MPDEEDEDGEGGEAQQVEHQGEEARPAAHKENKAGDDFPDKLDQDFPEELDLELIEKLEEGSGQIRDGEGGTPDPDPKESFSEEIDTDFPENLDQELLEELPVWSNTPHTLSLPLEKLGEGDLGWGGGV